MEKVDSALSQWIVLYTHYFNFQFFIFIHFTTQITVKESLAEKLKLISKFGSIKRQINIPLWTRMGHKGWWKDGKKMVKGWKNFYKVLYIALKFWNEFNANFVLLYFSSYMSIKIWQLYLKNVEKNNKVVYLRLLFTYLHQNLHY